MAYGFFFFAPFLSVSRNQLPAAVTCFPASELSAATRRDRAFSNGKGRVRRYRPETCRLLAGCLSVCPSVSQPGGPLSGSFFPLELPRLILLWQSGSLLLSNHGCTVTERPTACSTASSSHCRAICIYLRAICAYLPIIYVKGEFPCRVSLHEVLRKRVPVRPGSPRANHHHHHGMNLPMDIPDLLGKGVYPPPPVQLAHLTGSPSLTQHRLLFLRLSV